MRMIITTHYSLLINHYSIITNHYSLITITLWQKTEESYMKLPL